MRARLTCPLIVCAGLCVAVGLVGCKGATLPATNVSSTGAKLNLHGEADTGPGFSYFEYWQTAVPSLKRTTPERTWPTGAQGDFGDTVKGLRQATSYSYRACGNDNGKPATCVNTRSFTTGTSGHSGIAHGCDSTGRICIDGGLPRTGLPNDGDPSWSPDATKIAYVQSGKLWVLNVGNGSSAQLGTESIGGHPDWSPDGTKIAVDNGVIRASDGARLSTADTRNPSWSPDGTKIAHECDPPGDPVYDEICVDGHPLTNTYLDDEGEPSWSPDGTKIAFSASRGCNNGYTSCRHIVVMNADGTNQTQITFGAPDGAPYPDRLPHLDGNPSWSPSGTQIAFEGLQWEGVLWKVLVVSANGGTPNILFDGIDPDWSPRP